MSDHGGKKSQVLHKKLRRWRQVKELEFPP